MAKYGNTIAYQIQTKLDATGLNQLQQQLSSVSKSFTEMGKNNSAYAETSMRSDIARIQQVQTALSKSFNTNLNLIDLSTFKKQLGDISLGSLQKTMSQTSEGTKAFNSMLGTIGQIDTGFKNISSLSDKIINTFGNTVRWGVTASIFQTIQNSLYRSVDYVKELDTSLNNIQIVTGETSSNLTEWAKSANEAAAQLGASTVAFTDAAQLYAQNGYNQEDYTKLAELTTKVANVTQQSTSEVSEQITSLMAGYKMSIDEAEDSLAGMAVVAAASASDLGELAAAEQKVASAASTLGVSQDELTAQLSTIISVTREAPEQVGNSLKTIYARLGDLSLGETLEDGVSLGDVSSTLNNVGVAVLDVNGEMRSMGDILEDLMAKWQELGRAEQQALAVKLAGKYQYNNLMTLLNNSDMYYTQKEMAGSSQGALDEQQAIYMESMEARLQTLQTKWEGVIQSVANADAVKPFIDAASTGLDIVSDIADTIGGMGPALTLVASLMTKAFSQNIAAGITNMVTNKQHSNMLAQNEDTIISMMGGTDTQGTASQFLKRTVGTRDTLTKEQAVAYNEELSRYVEVDNKVKESSDAVAAAYDEAALSLEKYGMVINKTTGEITANSEKLDEMESAYNGMANTIKQIDNIGNLVATDKWIPEEGELESLKSLINDIQGNDVLDSVSKLGSEYRDAVISIQEIDVDKIDLQSADEGKVIANALSTIKEGLNQCGEAYVSIKNNISDYRQALDEGKVATEAQREAMINAARSAQSINYQQITQQIISMTGAVSQVAFAWQSFQSLGSIWADDDATSFEKLYKTVLSLLVTVPQLVSSWSQLTKSIENIKTAKASLAKSSEEVTKAEALEVVGKNVLAASESKEAVEANKAAAAKKQEALAQEQETQTEGKGTASSTKHAVADAKEADAANKAAAAKKQEALAQKELNSAEAAGTAGDVAETVAEVASTGISASKNVGLLAGGLGTLTSSFAGAAEGGSILSTVFSALGGWPGIIIAGISLLGSGISAAFGAASESAEEAKEKIKELSDSSAEEIDTIKTARNEFNELYKKYQAGEISSGELKTKADEINSIVDDQTQIVHAANDEWEAYYKNLNGGVSSATSSTLLLDAKNNEAQLEQASKDYVSAPGALYSLAYQGYGTNADDIDNIAGASYSKAQSVQNISKAYEESGAFASGLNAFKAGTDAEVRAKAIEKVSEAYETELTKLSQSMVKLKEGTDEYAAAQKEYKAVSDAQEDFKKTFVSPYSDKLQAYEDAKSKTASGYVEALKNDKSVQYSPDDTKTTEENLQAYKEQIKKVLSSYGLDVGEESAQAIVDAFIQGMAEANPDTQLAKDTGAATSQDVQDAKMGFAQETYTTERNSGKSEEEANAAADEFYASLSRFTDDEIIELKASIDYTTLKENADEIIRRLNDGDDLTDIIADITVDEDSVEKAKDEVSDYLDNNDYTTSNFTSEKGRASKFDTTAEEVEHYTEALQRSGGLLEELADETKKANSESEDLQKSLKGQIRQLEASGDTVDENGNSLNDLKKKLSNAEAAEKSNGKQLERMTNKAIESAEAIEYLSKNFDDNKDVLSNTKSSYKEITDATNDLIPGIEGLLNIDMSGWSQDMKNAFMVDPTNLENLEAAINGDEEALQRLRSAAAEQILVYCGIDPNTSSDLYSDMLSIITWAQLNLPDIQAGASIDDTIFTAQLEQIIQKAYDAGMAVDQIMNFLSGLGIDAEIETVSETYEGKAQLAEAVSSGDEMAITTAAQSYSGSIEVPKVRLKKDENGNALVKKTISGPSVGARSGRTGSNNSGSNGGSGGSGSSGGGSGSSPSSGGSSSGSENDDYSDDQTELTENEIDRYEKVNAHLDDIAENLDKVADEQDRLTGQKYIENIAQQVSLLKEEVEWEEKKLEIEKQEAAEYKSILGNDYGIKFNNQGFVENYADIYNRLLAQVNEYERQYNATTSKSAKDSIQTQIDAAEKRLENFNDYIEKYDTLLTSTITESEKKIQDYYNDIEDLQIEAFNQRLDAFGNVKDFLENRADFTTNLNRLLGGDYGDEDPYNDTINALMKIKAYWDADSEAMQEYYATLIAKQKEILNSSTATAEEKKWAQSRIDNYTAYKEGHAGDLASSTGDGLLSMAMKDLADIKEQWEQFQKTGKSDIFGENSAELLAAMQTAEENAAEAVESMKDAMNDLKDSIMEMIDDIGDEIDERLEKFDDINDKLDSYDDIIQSIYGDEAYDKINEVLSAQIVNGQNQVKDINKTIDTLTKLRDAMEEGSDEWNEVNDKITEAQEKLLDTTSDTLDKMAEMYENKINAALSSWTSNTALGSDLDWVSDEWELINRNADQYLDDVNSAYNIQKLQSKYLDLLDNSNQLAVQNQITDQMNQQLAYLREKDKLSQYDVDYANAQLEILQKRIVLEEAQRNKSQMKLKRDNQGNYSYVYTANEDDVKSAEEDLLDADNNAYNLSKDQIKQVQDDSLSALQDAKNMLSQIWTDANLTVEQKTERTKTIIDSLKTYLLGCQDQLSTAETNIIQDFISMCDSLTDENSTNLQDVLEQLKEGNNEAFNEIDERFTTSITTWLNNLDSFAEETSKVFGEGGTIQNAIEEYQKNLEKLEEKSKVPLSNMSAAVGEVKNEMDGLANSTAQYISVLDDLSGKTAIAEKALQEMNTKIQDSENSLRAFQGQYNDVSNKLVVSEREKADLQGQYAQLQEEYAGYKAQKEAAAAAAASSGGGDGDWSPYDDAYGIWMYGDWGGGHYWYGPYAAANGVEKANQVLALFNRGYGYTWMDTGGYTGDWGPGDGMPDAKNGKMAILHSKELVLNADDTENILQAVQAVRQLTINFRNGAFEDTVDAFNKYGSALLQNSFDSSQTVDQNVHIEATFPNVKGAEEIESALLSLTNGAIQYANRSGQF